MVGCFRSEGSLIFQYDNAAAGVCDVKVLTQSLRKDIGRIARLR